MKAEKKADEETESPEVTTPRGQALASAASPADDRFDELKDQFKKVVERLNEVEDQLAQATPLAGASTPLTSSSKNSRKSTIKFRNEDSIHDDEGRKSTASIKFRKEDSIQDDEGQEPAPRVSLKIPSQRSILKNPSLLSQRSDESSEYDPWDGKAPDYQACEGLKPPKENRRHTIFGQHAIARSLPLPLKILGISLAFITVICIWECIDLVVKQMHGAKELRLISYLGIVLTSALCLALSHQWVLTSHSSLVPSFAYSLSTLVLAIGVWGMVVTSVNILVESERKKTFCYASAGTLALVATVGYGVQTRHNVLLDIASCASTLGLHEEDVDIDDEETGSYASQEKEN